MVFFSIVYHSIRGKLVSPRVLSCLHVFCEPCIDKLLNEEEEASKANFIFKCPDCEQNTAVSV